MKLETRSIKFKTFKNKMRRLIKDLEFAMKSLQIESNNHSGENICGKIEKSIRSMEKCIVQK